MNLVNSNLFISPWIASAWPGGGFFYVRRRYRPAGLSFTQAAASRARPSRAPGPGRTRRNRAPAGLDEPAIPLPA
jgi:hypothetical protein